MIFLPPVTRTIVNRQIYPLSYYCPGQNFTSEPAPSPPSQKRVTETKGANQTAVGDFRKGTRLEENRQGAGSIKIETPEAASQPFLSHLYWQEGFV